MRLMRGLLAGAMGGMLLAFPLTVRAEEAQAAAGARDDRTDYTAGGSGREEPSPPVRVGRPRS